MDAQISLTSDDALRAFVATQVLSGRFSGADEVSRAALPLLASGSDGFAALRAALIEG